MKPMLAIDHDPSKVPFPCWGSPKLDGLRGLIKGCDVLSRSLKLIPNRHVQKVLGQTHFNGFDGELVAGPANHKNCMQASTSFFMGQDKVDDDWTYYVFDQHDMPDHEYDSRRFSLENQFEELQAEGLLIPNIILHEQRWLENYAELEAYETELLLLGYEGMILRRPDGHYKFGRSTVNEGLLLKVKRFVDAEAVVLGFAEQMENTNEKRINELGRSKRSSHKEGLVGKGTLGALLVRDLVTGVEFSIGTGLNDGVRAHIWRNRDTHEGKIVKYKSFPIGVKDAPRHPVFIGFRDPIDMS